MKDLFFVNNVIFFICPSFVSWKKSVKIAVIPAWQMSGEILVLRCDFELCPIVFGTCTILVQYYKFFFPQGCSSVQCR